MIKNPGKRYVGSRNSHLAVVFIQIEGNRPRHSPLNAVFVPYTDVHHIPVIPARIVGAVCAQAGTAEIH